MTPQPPMVECEPSLATVAKVGQDEFFLRGSRWPGEGMCHSPECWNLTSDLKEDFPEDTIMVTTARLVRWGATFLRPLPPPDERGWDAWEWFFGRDAGDRVKPESYWTVLPNGDWFFVECRLPSDAGWASDSIYALPLQPVQPEVPACEPGYRWQEVGEEVSPEAELLVRGEWVGAWDEVFGAEITWPYVFRVPTHPTPVQEPVRGKLYLYNGQRRLGYVEMTPEQWVQVRGASEYAVILPDDGTWEWRRKEDFADVAARLDKWVQEGKGEYGAPTDDVRQLLREATRRPQTKNLGIDAEGRLVADPLERDLWPKPPAATWQQDGHTVPPQATPSPVCEPTCGVAEVISRIGMHEHILVPSHLEIGTEIEWRERGEPWPGESEHEISADGVLIFDAPSEFKRGDKVFVRRAE